MTARKNTARPTAAAKAAHAATTGDQHISDAQIRAALDAEMKADFVGLWASLQEKLTPSPLGKTIIMFVARITLYAIGFVAALYVITYLSALAQAAMWPLFIIAVMEIVGFVLAFVASWTASDAIVNYVAAGNVSRDIKRIGTWIGDKLNSGKSAVQRRFETIH